MVIPVDSLLVLADYIGAQSEFLYLPPPKSDVFILCEPTCMSMFNTSWIREKLWVEQE